MNSPGDKRFKTLQAEAARLGLELITSTDSRTGGTVFLLHRWGRIRAFADLSLVEEALAKIAPPRREPAA